MDFADEETPPPGPEPFAGGIEIAEGGPDDPLKALWQGLAAGDADRAIGAFRLLEATGKTPDLEPTLALELADLLEKNERYLDAARACRLAAETDLTGVEAPVAILRGAKLLLGPAQNREAGEAMLRFFIERFPEHRLFDRARKLLDAIERGEATGLEVARQDGVVDHLRSPADFVPPAPPSDPAPGVGTRLSQTVQKFTGRIGSDRYRIIARVFKIAIIFFCLVYAVTWYLRDDHRTVDTIHPAVLKEPIQTPPKSTAVISFSRNGYAYQVTPRADYDISGLVVSLKDYTFMSVKMADEVFPMDLCLLWGENIKNGVYKASTVSFSQHGRFCVTKYTGPPRPRIAALSNNHLLMASSELDDVLEDLNVGDQVRIRGHLVNVKAKRLGQGSFADPLSFTMATSTNRTDSRGGACEVIYVRDLTVFEPHNRTIRAVSRLSFWLVLGLLGIGLLRLVLLPIRIREIH
jgi:hypothetical protein